MTTKTNMVRGALSLFRLAKAFATLFFFVGVSCAGEPRFIAGSSYFNSGTMGQPITWSLGQVNYYTDQGDLSPILPNSAANAFVTSAFNVWTSVSNAALTATSAGKLAEDVNGSNIAAIRAERSPPPPTSQLLPRKTQWASFTTTTARSRMLCLAPARRFVAVLLECRLRRCGQLRCRSKFSPCPGSYQRPVRFTVVAAA